MRAYQCSKCTELRNYDDWVWCPHITDMRPGRRRKGDAQICKKWFKELPKRERWCDKFFWENKE